LKTKSVEEVANALKHCFYSFGVPVSIQADNGKEFSNETLRSMCQSMNIQIIHGRLRNPKAQGLVKESIKL
jgi:transposase InsO family protein